MTERPQQVTPMLKQYWEVKSRYPDKDTILFFRMGDFYEMFFEDATVASKILDIALTTRNKNMDEPVPLCGVPFHSVDGYISKLLASGKKVAICEQVEDPSVAKGIVRRDVIRVVTPGTIIEPETLESTRHNFLVATNQLGENWGLAAIDVTTGLFRVFDFNSIKDLKDEIARLEPSEVLVSRSFADAGLGESIRTLSTMTVTVLDDPQFDPEVLKPYICTDSFEKIPDSAKAAAGAICNYVSYTAKEILHQIKDIEVKKTSSTMVIDESTKRNLELTKTMIEGSTHGSLFWLLNETLTSMGARLLRDWLVNPLTDTNEIRERHNGVSQFVGDVILAGDISTTLSKVSDIERIAGRLSMETASPRDMASLKTTLNVLPYLIEFKTKTSNRIRDILENITPLDEVKTRIEKTIVDEPPIGLKDGGIIKDLVSQELDELRQISHEGKGFIARLETKERERTGINSLKVRYNRVFGYYIEVTHTHRDRVPSDYIRKQTLANAERFITPELKEFEEKVLGAEERIKALEYDLYTTFRGELKKYVDDLKRTAQLIAELDVILSFAATARNNRYVEPEMIEGDEISIKEGRHPIIEKINTSERFVANDIYLNNTTDRLLIITGPNMAGKSTVMRQVAIIILMAQIGSFVPAKAARLGVVDRIFTRVGASDNIMRGQSTFMVEMMEAASILKDATQKSLIVIDEIGRGTSTFDGVAIAWAVAEYIHDTIKAKTLFATHYHELIDLVLTKKGAKNFNIAVKEWNDKIIFLHKLVTGGVNHSYGIQVAQLAGLPLDVIKRAREVLVNLESGELDEVGLPKIAHSLDGKSGRGQNVNQLQLFHGDSAGKIVDQLKNANLDVMTPIEALNLVHKLKSEI